MALPCQRHLFELPEDVAYLRCAASAPQLKAVHEAGRAALAARARPWETEALAGPEAFEALRGQFAGLIGASADDVAIVPAASYGLSTAAANLRLGPGRRVIVLAAQFPSNVYPWRELAGREGGEVVTVAPPADGDWTAALLAEVAAGAAIVALPAYHWTDGGRIELERIAPAAHDAGAALVLDLSQSIGAVPFDVARIRPDYLVTVGQKWLMGPQQLAYFYVAPERRQGRPLEHNWVARLGSEDHTALVDYVDAFQPGARRFDGGARGNPLAVPMAAAALAQVARWGVAEIAETLAPMVAEIAVRGEALGLVPTPAGVRAPHFLGLRAPGGLPRDLAARLAAEGVYVSIRGDAIRVAPNVYNSPADIDRLFGALEPALATSRRQAG